MRVSHILTFIVQCTDIPTRCPQDTWGPKLAGIYMLAANDNNTTQSSSKWK